MTKKKYNGFVANAPEERLARALGWFSIGLGLMQILAPRRLGRTIGVGEHPTLMRLLGIREFASGLSILTKPNPTPALKARVAGDAMDLALLGTALASPGTSAARVVAATAAVAGVTALDVRAAQKLSRNPGVNIQAVRASQTIIIDRSREELFQFWRNFENLPRFMTHLHRVQVRDLRRSHWTARGPAKSQVEWDAEIVNERENELIAWRSLPGSDINLAGAVRFEPATGGRGTLVKVEMLYDPPAGVLGATVAKLFGESPEKQVHVELHRFKQLMETGEIARTDGQPAGRSRSTSLKYDDFVQT
jgi:uncharacterized membrane protein